MKASCITHTKPDRVTPSNDNPTHGRKTPAWLLPRIFLPFAIGYFLSYLLRTVNAILAPDIAADTGLSAADIGLLTSMYFLAFGAFQLPLGMLLDRFGPRRVEAMLLLMAAAGSIIFGLFDSLAGLALGRALIGAGMSCGLMAGFKAFALWFRSDRMPVLNGFMLTFGGLGALASTLPVQLLLNVVDWHELFIGLGIFTIVLAGIVLVMVPEHRGAIADLSLRDQLSGLRQVYTDPFFWRVTPAAAITIGTSLSVQSLWAGPWLGDVQGLSPVGVASHLMLAAAFMGMAYPVIGIMARALTRTGLTIATITGTGMTCFMLIIATMAAGAVTYHWFLMAAFGFLAAFGSLSFVLLGQHFPPELVGRANTAMNMLVFTTAFAMQWGLGAIIGHWSDPVTGRHMPMGYHVGFGLLATLQTLAMLWFFVIGPRVMPKPAARA